jgi:hypothetical protein
MAGPSSPSEKGKTFSLRICNRAGGLASRRIRPERKLFWSILFRTAGRQFATENTKPMVPEKTHETVADSPANQGEIASLLKGLDYEAIEVFDFDRNWSLVIPFLHEPEIEALLGKCVNAFITSRNIERLRRNPTSTSSFKPYDAKEGPWRYTPSFYWVNRREAQMEKAIDAGDFEILPDNATYEDEEEYYDAYDLLADEFYPQPETYEWYQLLDGSRCLAPWLKALAARVFPQYEWNIVEGKQHSLVYGCDGQEKIRVLFDILKFAEMSSKQLIEFVTGQCE